MSAAAAADAAPPAPVKAGKKKLIIIIAAAALVLGGGGVGALVYMKKKAAAEAEAAAALEDGGEAAAKGEHAAAKPAHKEGDHKVPVFVPMDPFIVNLADHEADRYAQIGVTLEVPDAHVGDEIKNYLPAIRNNVLMLIAHKTSADLAGREGKELLAKEILRESARAMGYEVDDEAPAAAEDAKADPKKKPKAKKPPVEMPILSVQFSSFIIQ